VGVVRGVQVKEVGGSKKYFYILQLHHNGSTILIPTDKVKDVGLRAIISEKEVPKIYRILKSKDEATDAQTWNRRYREYMEKIKTGSIFEIAEVLRDLYRLKFKLWRAQDARHRKEFTRKRTFTRSAPQRRRC
jgi:CarD family transcriptional regulator